MLCQCGVPQGSVLGPLLFTAYVSSVGDRIQSHGTSYYQFADDVQLFIAMNTSDTTLALERLAVCSSAVRLWFLHNGLQLSADKSKSSSSAQSTSFELPPTSRLLKSLAVS